MRWLTFYNCSLDSCLDYKANPGVILMRWLVSYNCTPHRFITRSDDFLEGQK